MDKKITVVLIFILVIFAFAHSQILEVNKPLFTDEPFFNTSFIKNNRILSITGSRSSKKVKDIIRTKGLDFYYEFNHDGLLKKQLSTFKTQQEKKDTNIIIYQYNDKRQIQSIRKSDSYGYFSYSYTYDNDNNLVNQIYSRDENAHDYKRDFDLQKQYIINSDSFSYLTLSDTQLKKFYYNKYNKVYKEQLFYYNEQGYLFEDDSKYLVGNKKSKITYEYDEKGRVATINTFQDLNIEEKVTEKYFYDEFDNVLEIKIYKNDIYKTSKQYLYDKKTLLLSAQLIQEVETEFIQIVQYQYMFYTGETTSLTLDQP